MHELFSRSLLRAFLTEFVNHSKAFKRAKFTRATVAQIVFSGSDSDNAKSHLSASYSPRGGRPLDGAVLVMIVDACRQLLRNQLMTLGELHPDNRAAEFEKGVCRKHKFAGVTATLDDFRLDRRTADALSADDFGVPDILGWQNNDFGFAEHLKAVQDRSVQAMHEVLAQIGRESDPQRRLKLLQIALSISYLNHPGTRWHEAVFNLALEAAGDAHLLLLTKGYNVPDHVQQPATRMTVHLNWSRLIPTLNSPTNYAHYALRGTPMPRNVWRDTQSFMEEAIVAANRYAEMRPDDEYAIELRSGVLSMKSRFLAVAENGGSLREADQLQRQSLRDVDRLSRPYGFAYPILKDLVRLKIKSAIRRCEKIVDTYDRAADNTSAAAFAALLVHLTALYGGDPTQDKHIRQLAAAAIASPAIRHKHSHIFDADAVESLLAKKDRPAARASNRRHTTQKK